MGRPPLSSALKTKAHEKGAIAMASREDNRRLAEAYNEAMGIGDAKTPRRADGRPPTTSAHNYAACQDPICPLCEAYGDGYTGGQGEGLLRGPHLAPEGTRSLVRV